MTGQGMALPTGQRHAASCHRHNGQPPDPAAFVAAAAAVLNSASSAAAYPNSFNFMDFSLIRSGLANERYQSAYGLKWT